MIKVNNLSKEFHEQGTRNELLAVDHVDFTIQDGSFCALVGESGSGKSTLAQLMCGLLAPSSGEVLFEGKNIALCRGKQKQVLRSKIQLILQDGKGAMDPRFTVYQIIAEPIRNFRKLTKKKEEREINDLLTMMELPEEIKLRKAHELSGGQGLDENIYYQLFVEIILVGIKEFERYRQNIVRKINAKNQVEGQKATPISDRVLNRPTSVSGLTKEEAKQLATEIKSYKKEGKQYQKDKEAVEARYKYDVRILNVLATTGLKASSIAHEMKNDRNAIYDNYNNIVDALKEYGMWDELNSSEKTRKSYKNVPYLLESNDVVGKKLVTFMDTMLEEIEKKQFEIRYQSIADILTVIKKVWERDYAWLSIEIIMDEDIVYQISEDILQVIFDNLILNSVQQNENTQKLMITISINETNGFLNIKYCDNGKGLDDKYKTDPMKILEVHETTRTNGHGLGMWIVNNTCTMSGGEIQKICGEKGFEIEFTIGGKI